MRVCRALRSRAVNEFFSFFFGRWCKKAIDSRCRGLPQGGSFPFSAAVLNEDQSRRPRPLDLTAKVDARI